MKRQVGAKVHSHSVRCVSVQLHSHSYVIDLMTCHLAQACAPLCDGGSNVAWSTWVDLNTAGVPAALEVEHMLGALGTQ